MQCSFLCLLAIAILAVPVFGVSPVKDELARARRWSEAKFAGEIANVRPDPCLMVLANHDPVTLNAREGRPLKLGETEYTRGLYCHAVSKIIVYLPGPAESFEAVIGVDHNNQTSGGRGSVIFSVNVAGKEAYKSGVMHGGEPGVPIKVDLGGASEFVLDISDAGDGISCDQSDWADARVTLADGSTLWLADLPIKKSAIELLTTDLPFSFNYDGQPSSELLKNWKIERSKDQLDGFRTAHTVTCTDPKTGLVVRAEAIEYQDYPTVEWTVYFKNTGKLDTPIISDIRALDASFQRGSEGEFILHHFAGSPCTATDYRPFETVLAPDTEKRISAAGGRPTNSDLSYFNIEWPEQGVIMVVGWPGQWSAEFSRDNANNLTVTAGQELTHLKLHPGEEIRTPLIVLQFYNGDWVRAQNIWRRWMMAYSMPKPGGKLPPPHFAACSSHQFGEMINANEENQKLFVDRYLEEGIKLDYWWMDAGWYFNNGSWGNTGTWEVDTKRFPNGLRAVSDHARGKGVKTIVWFEPERVTPGTWLYDNHPEWMLKGGSNSKVLNLGNPEAWNWLVNHIDKFITDQGIDLYRQDCNIDPLAFWRMTDSEDRQGITEIRYVEGYLAYWDELLKRYPNMLIDSCASGGRRNDLETLRRSVPLLRSDYIFEPIGQQNHTYGISFWVPFYGTGVKTTDIYTFRSNMCPAKNCCLDMRDPQLDYASLRTCYRQWEEVADNFYGDYYPLTPYSPDSDVWMAWQFDRPEADQGMVQAFRRENCIFEAARFKLKGLDPDAVYEVKDLDSGTVIRTKGSELLDKGLRIELTQSPDSAIITYKKVSE